MSRRTLWGDLNAVRTVVHHGLARLDETAGGLDQYWLDAARSRLRGLDDLLVAAAGGLSGWSHTLIGAALSFPVVWAAAAAADAVGFAPTWVIMTAVLVMVAIEPPLAAVTNLLAGHVDRRRMARTPRPASVAPGDPCDLAAPLLAARVMLVSAALRRVEPRHWRVPYLVRLAGSERSIGRIAEADLLLCQAIDYLEIYLAEREPGRVG